MTKVELAQKIGAEVCEDCGPESDCGITPIDCGRITNAVDWIETFLNQIASRPKQIKGEKDGRQKT